MWSLRAAWSFWGRIWASLTPRRSVLHGFVKKSNKTPLREREIAVSRLKEIKHENP